MAYRTGRGGAPTGRGGGRGGGGARFTARGHGLGPSAAGALAAGAQKLQPNPPRNTRESSVQEVQSNAALVRYLDEVAPLESEDSRRQKELSLDAIGQIFREFVAEVAADVGERTAPSDGTGGDVEDEGSGGGVADSFGAKLYVSGSYKLCVSTTDSDIDTVCVAPQFVTRDHFFERMVPRLRADPRVSDLLPVPSARIPIIEVVFNGHAIDLQFVALPMKVIPRSLNILDDSVLLGLDTVGVSTLNGPRVNEMLPLLVKNMSSFQTLLRILRLWGKARGLYSNKMGYLGGVNFAIFSAYMCQLYPNLCPAALAVEFFKEMKAWRWPRAMTLTPPYAVPSMNHEIWDPDHNISQRFHDLMPIITPAYPCMNSAYNVFASSLAVMRNEFLRGAELCEVMFAQPDGTQHRWELLCQPTQFFLRYDDYLALDITAKNDKDLAAWKGYVESRVRVLCSKLDASQGGLQLARPFPRDFAWKETIILDTPQAVALSTALTSPAKEAGSDAAGATSEAAPGVPTADADADADAVQSADAPSAPSGDVSHSKPLVERSSFEFADDDAGVEGSGYVAGADDMAADASAATGPVRRTVTRASEMKDLEQALSGKGDDEVEDAAQSRSAAGGSGGVLDASTLPTVDRMWFTYYVAIEPDRDRYRDAPLNLAGVFREFKAALATRFSGYQAGMRIKLRHLPWADVPDEMFSEGRTAATELRERQLKHWIQRDMFTSRNVRTMGNVQSLSVGAASSALTSAADNSGLLQLLRQVVERGVPQELQSFRALLYKEGMLAAAPGFASTTAGAGSAEEEEDHVAGASLPGLSVPAILPASASRGGVIGVKRGASTLTAESGDAAAAKRVRASGEEGDSSSAPIASAAAAAKPVVTQLQLMKSPFPLSFLTSAPAMGGSGASIAPPSTSVQTTGLLPIAVRGAASGVAVAPHSTSSRKLPLRMSITLLQ